MYLIMQVWWLMVMAFLIGALVGYVVWRACGRRQVLAEFERQKKDLRQRLGSAENERDQFQSAALDAEKEVARLASLVKAVSKPAAAHGLSRDAARS